MSIYLIRWTYGNGEQEFGVTTSLREARRAAVHETDAGEGESVEILRVKDTVSIPVRLSPTKETSSDVSELSS